MKTLENYIDCKNWLKKNRKETVTVIKDADAKARAEFMCYRPSQKRLIVCEEKDDEDICISSHTYSNYKLEDYIDDYTKKSDYYEDWIRKSLGQVMLDKVIEEYKIDKEDCYYPEYYSFSNFIECEKERFCFYQRMRKELVEECVETIVQDGTDYYWDCLKRYIEEINYEINYWRMILEETV